MAPNLQADSTYQNGKINYGAGEIVPESGAPENPYGQHYVGQYTPPDGKNVKPTTAAGTSLDRLVRDIKDKVKTAKDFWIQLPYSVCNDEKIAAQPDKDDQCWNGQDRAKYVLFIRYGDSQIHVLNEVKKLLLGFNWPSRDP